MSVGPAPKISLSLGVKKVSQPAPTNGVKRPHAALGEDHEDHEQQGRAEAVSHFDQREGGAITTSKPKASGPLVIAPQSNRDWKEASKRNKRQRSGLPPDVNQAGLDERVAQIEAEFESRKAKFGLNVKNREDGKDVFMVGGEEGSQKTIDTEQQAPQSNDQVSVSAQTEDQRALDALLGKEQKSDLVLPSAANDEEAFQRDFTSAPDMSTLADYDRVPVEQFGAALLRGMGWKDGEGIGAQRGRKVEKSKIPERRPALLGIGAKEEAAVAQEMGVWGKAARGKKGDIKIYNPVLLRDKRTGEKFTEEEWEKRKQAAEREQYEMEFERKEQERRLKEDRYTDPERGERRDKSRRQDKGDSRSHRDDRNRRDDKPRRRGDHDSDEDYYRRKEKDRRRHDREDVDHDRSSRRHEQRPQNSSSERSHRDRHR